jgi:tRNA threonylcarbamoyladenosine biosynthesis protein TsaB
MKILAIDCCSSSCSAAVIDENKLLSLSLLDCGLGHSKTILVQIDQVLKNAGLTLRDMDYIATTVGPGSFTGIRIGVSTAKGLSQSTGIGLIPLSTMDALSYSNTAPDGTIIACALDARRQQEYNALFEIREGKPCRLCEDRALAIEELGEELAQKGAPVLFVGDGAHRPEEGRGLPDGSLLSVNAQGQT